jgi:hypothetical protein
MAGIFICSPVNKLQFQFPLLPVSLRLILKGLDTAQGKNNERAEVRRRVVKYKTSARGCLYYETNPAEFAFRGNNRYNLCINSYFFNRCLIQINELQL